MNRIRRSIPYIAPFLIILAASIYQSTDFFLSIIGYSFIWVPYILACWLSDGFTNIKETGSDLYYDVDVDPSTNESHFVFKDQNGNIVI